MQIEWQMALLYIFGSLLAVLIGSLYVAMLWAGQLNRPKRAPPGSFGLPVIGEMLDFVSDHKSEFPQAYAEKRRAKYGDVFTTHHMCYPTVMSVDPEVNKFVLQNEGKYFISRYPKSLQNLFGEGAILRAHGDLHKRLHNMALSFINSTKLKEYVMADVEQFVTSAMTNWVGRTVYVEDEAKTVGIHIPALIAFQVIIKYLLGLMPGEETAYLMHEYRKLIEGVISIPVQIPGTQYYKSMRARENVIKIVKKIIEERRRHPDAEHRDILAALMAETNENGEKFSDNVICSNILNFMGAGEETSPMIMMCAVKYISECSKAYDELREEHMTIRKTKRAGEGLTWSDYTSMTFTHQVINETLRLVNPASGVLREAIRDVEVKGYFIPKGWLVLPYFRSVHVDETVYPDPLSFNPWRWKEKIPSTYFSPFGGGTRLCAGQELAKLEVAIFLHHLVTQFTWEAHGDEIINFPAVTFKNLFPITVKPLQYI
eukprot:Gb_15250 [translate_table: standard]